PRRLPGLAGHARASIGTLRGAARLARGAPIWRARRAVRGGEFAESLRLAVAPAHRALLELAVDYGPCAGVSVSPHPLRGHDRVRPAAVDGGVARHASRPFSGAAGAGLGIFGGGGREPASRCRSPPRW